MVFQAVRYTEVVRKQHVGALCTIAIAYEIGKTSLSKESHASCHIPLCPTSQSESSELSPSLAQSPTLPTLFIASSGSAPMVSAQLYPAKGLLHSISTPFLHILATLCTSASSALSLSDHAWENQTILLRWKDCSDGRLDEIHDLSRKMR